MDTTNRRRVARPPEPMTDEKAQELRELIGRLSFRFAKTMPDQPHEYTARSPETEADYVELWRAIDRHGVREWVPERPGAKRYKTKYLRPGDGWRYWAMGGVHQSRILNRARIED